MVDFIDQNIIEIRERIRASAKLSGRDPAEIKLMGVSKTHPAEYMLSAAGKLDILGENRVQEAADKRLDWPSEERTPWHLIGHLQRNKARKALDIFDLIETVDSLGLARMLDRILTETDAYSFPVYIEVNMSGELTKSGVVPQEAASLLERMMQYCPRLSVEGLMTIGPNSDDKGDIRKAFEGLRLIRDELRSLSGLHLPELSMGMSSDFEIAVEEGSTIVRIGSGIFGRRSAG
ncbi:MAG: YggS family pyridoxal phosphate-dependent enzyme [Synergistaceae bacterium]|nr:YggS family pyridoxal phosphate-dependent enzyme [Synergistaceae bacterium]